MDEGGQSRVGPEHVLLSDVDSMEDRLQVALQGEPQHGALQLGGRPLTPGQAFTLQDLKRFKVRSDILLPSSVYFLLRVPPDLKV